ncbi:unnamed protein product [Dovyalis caffra]|uniref:Uncharacterized protein n=1 Tax=Dovyalis caffra TaxID=77055 RepID=A0AAV1R4C3_9ROSI|nr:unnamed protein product [Dovyalis caffra]
MESARSKICIATSPKRHSHRLLFDRRYGWVFDEWKDPSEEALSGGRGIKENLHNSSKKLKKGTLYFHLKHLRKNVRLLLVYCLKATENGKSRIAAVQREDIDHAANFAVKVFDSPDLLSPEALQTSLSNEGRAGGLLVDVEGRSSTRSRHQEDPNMLKGDDNDEKIKGDGGELEEGLEGDSAFKGTLLAGVLLVGVVGGFGAVGYIYKDQINAFLNQFSGFIEAGLLFGSLIGTVIVSISGTVAASIAFLIARYFARERILKLVEGNKNFLQLTKQLGKMGSNIWKAGMASCYVWVFILCPDDSLIPVLNDIHIAKAYIFADIIYISSWLGMIPGTWAYVSAGAFGRAIIQDESELGLGGGNGGLWTLGLGLLATAIAATYVTQLAKDAVKDIE